MLKNTTRTLVLGLVGLLAVAGAVACKSGPDDAAITASVKTKLAADSVTKALAINVDTKEGVVTLNGTVETAEAKTKAETIAKGTEGVKSVTNNLTVKPAVATTTPADAANDTAIKNAVEANLKKAGVTGVTVEVKNGDVMLSGEVPKADRIKVMQAANEANPKPNKVDASKLADKS